MEEIERVGSFQYLGAKIEANGKTTPEIRRRLAMATSKLKKMTNIWKGQCIETEIRVLKSTVFPTTTYGCETWSINKTDAKKITAFEMKCYRKILSIQWTERITNKEVLTKIGIGRTKRLKNTYWKQKWKANEEEADQREDGSRTSKNGLI